MGATRVNLTIDEATKKEVMPLLDDFGMDMSTAVNIFFKSIVRERRFPLQIEATKMRPKTAFDMNGEELTEYFCTAVANRNVTQEPEYVLAMDLTERKPYRLYPDGRKEYIDD